MFFISRNYVAVEVEIIYLINEEIIKKFIHTIARLKLVLIVKSIFILTNKERVRSPDHGLG